VHVPQSCFESSVRGFIECSSLVPSDASVKSSLMNVAEHWLSSILRSTHMLSTPRWFTCGERLPSEDDISSDAEGGVNMDIKFVVGYRRV
jgi:hypothetical protein